MAFPPILDTAARPPFWIDSAAGLCIMPADERSHDSTSAHESSPATFVSSFWFWPLSRSIYQSSIGQCLYFTNTGSLNIPREYHTATLLLNGKVSSPRPAHLVLLSSTDCMIPPRIMGSNQVHSLLRHMEQHAPSDQWRARRRGASSVALYQQRGTIRSGHRVYGARPVHWLPAYGTATLAGALLVGAGHLRNLAYVQNCTIRAGLGHERCAERRRYYHTATLLQWQGGAGAWDNVVAPGD